MAGATKTTDMSNVQARELDFVTRFNRNWEKLRAILGITRPIRKAPGTKLVAYEATMKDSSLATSPAEGVDITATEFQVTPKSFSDITVEKYKKAVTLEAVAKYGATIAVEKTDDAFLLELQNKVMSKFYTFLATGTLKGTQKTWQRALAIAKGAVLNKFSTMGKTCTGIVGFANIMDLYSYLGDKEITVQSAFGLFYLQNFLGYETLFLMDASVIPEGTVIALPKENIDLYYVDPSDSEFAALGLEYETGAGETNLIGFHANGNYSNATGESYAIMGMTLWAEFLDAICIVTVDSSKANTNPAVDVSAG